MESKRQKEDRRKTEFKKQINLVELEVRKFEATNDRELKHREIKGIKLKMQATQSCCYVAFIE